MYTKSTLRKGVCFCIFSCLVLAAFSQQRRKFIEGLPFTYYQRQPNNHPVSSRGAYRSYDGTGNNADPKKSDYGATFIPLFRELPAQFGSADLNNTIGGAGRPSPRQISNAVVDEPVTTFNAELPVSNSYGGFIKALKNAIKNKFSWRSAFGGL